MSNCLLPKSNFIHIPKCGGTAVHTLLWKTQCLKHHSQVIREPHYGHLFATQMPVNGKPFFTFVRDPVSWWLSYYHWNKNTAHSRFDAAELACKSFDEWVNGYGQFWLGHYSRIVRRYIGDDPNFPTPNRVTLIGKTENLFSDLQRILDTVGEEYRKDILEQYIEGKQELIPAHKNNQEYDKEAVSEDSKRIIICCERYVIEKFEYGFS